MTRYFIGLGSNVGDRLGHLVGACQQIGERLGSWEGSAIYETEPVGGPDQDPFLNAVVAVDSDLDPPALLDVLHVIEAGSGRERTVRWGPRTLDLDIVAWDGPPYSDDRLVIPHPRAAERAFVLAPLAERWPDAVVGPGGVNARRALGHVDRKGVDRLSGDWAPPVSKVRAELLVGGQFLILAAVLVGVVSGGTIPSGLTLPVLLGALLAVAGLTLALASARMHGSTPTASPLPTPGTALVESGPYRVVRHPIYAGVCLTMIGVSTLSGSLPALIAAAALVPYLWLKAGYEERWLRLRLAGYLAYRRRVRWRLIPFVT